MSVETHVRINLRQVAERLSMSETALARSVSASLPPMPSPAMPAGSASPQSGGGLDQSENSLSTADAASAVAAPLLPPGRPKPSAPIRVRPRQGDSDDGYGAATSYDRHTPPRGTPPQAGTYSAGAAGLARSPSKLSPQPAGAGTSDTRFLVGSIQHPGAASLRSSHSRPVDGAVRRYATREAALSSLDGGRQPMNFGFTVGGESPGGHSHSDGQHSESRTPPPPTNETFANEGSDDEGPRDLLVSTTADGKVEVSFVAREEPPDNLSGLTRAESRLTRHESRLNRQESRLNRQESRLGRHESRLGASPEQAPKPKKRVHFPTEPISQVTIFQTAQQQVVLQVKYRRPGWCLMVGAIAAVLRALVWALASRVIFDRIRLTGPQYRDDAAEQVHDEVRTNIAIATRVGFEIYGGCAVLYALVMLIFWRPSSRDLRSLQSRREKQRLAICVLSGAIGRLAFVLSLGLAISATYVGIHHALPLVWVTGYRAWRKSKSSLFQDLLAGGALSTAVAVILGGDMVQPEKHWELMAKWAALPLVVLSSFLRAVQRYRTKGLKAHFSYRLMLLSTMIADAFVLLVAALVADAGVFRAIAAASADEYIAAGVAICAMLIAVISDVLLSKYFDLLSALSLTALTLPAAAAFFRAFSLGGPQVSFIMVSSLCTILAVVIALSSGEMNKRTKSLVLGEEGEEDGSPSPRSRMET